MHIIIRDLGLCSWLSISKAMNDFTKIRNYWTCDELWLTEHYPVFTYGLSEKNITYHYINNIPIFLSNRGGKITYHGPGQLVVYILLNLKRNKIKFRYFINTIENIVIQVLRYFYISAHIKKINREYILITKKICSLGLRIIKGCSLHGFSLNVNMNLIPFQYIHPCGEKNIKMTQIYHYNKNIKIHIIKKILIQKFCKNFKILKYCKYSSQ
ncbi:lipoate-protein ligase B [Buchnera aphidicola (Cinara tujafilina)]|uniref:Octanoyltransferase n=1 Tax=Buchnera aphidicola (Cinara tujafilina) TaxID=261317 RepID=F7WZU2_9GAMM|nr:lipoyl(octanoyl) transferase LipB [Buchnera aphidicola]AEH39760.1 lipoate-protein ligase B [Buchnera aphidicola (Cinara tujafilina)]